MRRQLNPASRHMIPSMRIIEYGSPHLMAWFENWLRFCEFTVCKGYHTILSVYSYKNLVLSKIDEYAPWSPVLGAAASAYVTVL